ncbi:MAG: hypothetical protein Phog2KO_24730 [Phototrophicaceae bacterium]
MSKAGYALPNSETIHHAKFDNGMTVLVYENPAVESVVIYGSLLTGSVFEPLQRSGIASMTANALLRGTTTRDFETLHSELEDIGAELDMSTSKYRVTFSGRALAEDFSTLMDVFADSLRNPIFDAQEVDEERSKRITELNFAHQDTRYMSARNFRQALYPDTHPFHYSTYGALNTLPDIQADDLRAFHQAQYGAGGMILVIVGAVSAEAVTAIAHDKLGDWHNPNQSVIPSIATLNPPQDVNILRTSITGKTQADVVIGTLGPSRYADDYLGAQIANSILGEFGMMGRVGNVIREQLGLAYYAYSRLDGGEGQGAWTITAGVAPDNVELTIEKAREEIQHLITDLVSKDDLADNQSYFTGRLPLRLESNFGLAATIHSIMQYDLGLDYLLGYHDAIFGLTREDILSASQHYLHPDKLIISVAG